MFVLRVQWNALNLGKSGLVINFPIDDASKFAGSYFLEGGVCVCTHVYTHACTRMHVCDSTENEF